MLAPIRAKLAAIWAAAKPTGNSIEVRTARLASALVLSCGLAGCLPVTAPLSGSDPADPAAKVARTGYRPVVAPYASLRPTEPGPWLEQNRRVAPAPRTGQ